MSVLAAIKDKGDAPTIDSLTKANEAAQATKEEAHARLADTIARLQRVNRVIAPGVSNAPTTDRRALLAALDEKPNLERQLIRHQIEVDEADEREATARAALKQARADADFAILKAAVTQVARHLTAAQPHVDTIAAVYARGSFADNIGWPELMTSDDKFESRLDFWLRHVRSYGLLDD